MEEAEGSKRLLEKLLDAEGEGAASAKPQQAILEALQGPAQWQSS